MEVSKLTDDTVTFGEDTNNEGATLDEEDVSQRSPERGRNQMVVMMPWLVLKRFPMSPLWIWKVSKKSVKTTLVILFHSCQWFYVSIQTTIANSQC